MAWDTMGTIRSDWNFDTVRSASAMGTFSSMARDLVPSSQHSAVDSDEETSDNDLEASINTGAATKGSDPIVANGLGSNSAAAHSTVVIKPLPNAASEKDISVLLAENDDSSPESTDGPETPADPLGAPPAYTGSVRHNRRSSYAARNQVNGAGTIMREADLGNGIDTIRPIKKLDAANSLRLSSEFVGNIRKEGSTSAPSSPTIHKRSVSEVSKAGGAIIDEVVLPIIDKVPSFQMLIPVLNLLLGHS